MDTLPRTPEFVAPLASTVPTADATAPTAPAAPLAETAPTAPRPHAARRSGRGAGRTVAIVAAASLTAGVVGGAVGASFTHAAPVVGSVTSSSAPVAEVASGATIESVASRVLPSVVSIAFTGQQGGGTGSGIVLTADGFILTNNHVVAGAADGGTLTVSFTDGRTAGATIVGRDPSADVAVIKADGVSDLTPAQLGHSADLKVGQQVVAIGSPLGLSGTVTSGIVSALNRPVRSGEAGSSETSVLNAIQTDAAVNPGNSGGALVDMAGRVVGINSAIATLGGAEGAQGGSIGLGFAIPIDQAQRIANELRANGSASRAVLGVAAESAAGGGATITVVSDGGAAAAAGLEVGDVVTSVGTTRIADSETLIATVRSLAPGSQVEVGYTRGGEAATVTVTLGSVVDAV